eukprot:m51a1_g5646 hypothetical protein (204) ;mRNA; f:859538-860699
MGASSDRPAVLAGPAKLASAPSLLPLSPPDPLSLGLARGAECEARLLRRLRAAGLGFRSEEDLRREGYTKTPDVMLDVPCAVAGPRGPRLANWVESKALFADPQTHRRYCQEQYYRYRNRYGPGVVIYWMGFHEDIARDDDVLVVDDLPPLEPLLDLKNVENEPPEYPRRCRRVDTTNRGAKGRKSIALMPASVEEHLRLADI